MTMGWLTELVDMVAAHGPVVRVSIVRAEGSAPRGAGVAMTVAADTFTGTIGGGALGRLKLSIIARRYTRVSSRRRITGARHEDIVDIARRCFDAVEITGDSDASPRVHWSHRCARFAAIRACTARFV